MLAGVGVPRFRESSDSIFRRSVCVVRQWNCQDAAGSLLTSSLLLCFFRVSEAGLAVLILNVSL